MIFRGTARSVEEFIATIYSDVNDWTSLLSEGDKLENSKKTAEDHPNLFQRSHISPMDEDMIDT